MKQALPERSPAADPEFSHIGASESVSSGRFWIAHAVFPIVLLVIAAVLETTGLDLSLSDPFFDFQKQRWPYHDVWWAEQAIHKGGSMFVLFISLGALASWALSFRFDRFRAWRRAVLYLVLSIALGTGLVALGKATTKRHCPCDYDRYGGDIPYTGLFTPAPSSCRTGHCFPAGHASGGFAFMSVYFIFYERGRRKALLGLLLGAGLGTLFGYGQVARGVHFVSHNFWTAAICWLSALALYALVFRCRILKEEHH